MTVPNVSAGNVINPATWGNQVANDVNYLLGLVPTTASEGVQRFSSASARSSAIPSPVTGQLTVRTDTGRLEMWNGTAWVPVAGDMPRAKGTPSTSTVIGSAAVVVLQWNTEEYDTAAMFTAFGTTITAAFTGMYLVTYRVTFGSAANGVRQTFIRKNGGNRYGDQTESVTGTATGITLSGSAEVYMAASEYVEVCAYQDTGVGLSCLASTSDYFSARFLGPA